jgi:glucose/arabinose dehydrogenase
MSVVSIARLVALLSLSSVVAAASRAAEPCKRLEQRPPNAPDQRPAAPDQTRACAIPSDVAFEVTVLADDIEHPWAVEPLPDGDLLVTERPGRMRIVTAAGVVGAPIEGLPAVDAGGQGGLLDVAASPAFARDRTLFWSYTEPRSGGNATSVARGVLSADRARLEDVRVVFRSLPVYDGDKHFGSRIAVAADGNFFVTLGERSDAPMRPHAQRLDGHLGKIVRIAPDGSAPRDNPFVGQADALPEIWSLGHRNVQAAALDARGRLWAIEHGTRGGDELNLVEAGENYGWPLAAYGIEYRGVAIAGSATTRPGTVQPVYYWDPVIAPSGMQFYAGDAFPAWRGDLFVGGLMAKALVRLRLADDRVVGEERLLADRGRRVRDVREGPDGALYVVTAESSGQLWRIAPRQ